MSRPCATAAIRARSAPSSPGLPPTWASSTSATTEWMPATIESARQRGVRVLPAAGGGQARGAHEPVPPRLARTRLDEDVRRRPARPQGELQLGCRARARARARNRREAAESRSPDPTCGRPPLRDSSRASSPGSRRQALARRTCCAALPSVPVSTPSTLIRLRDRPLSRGSLQYYPPHPRDAGGDRFGVAPHTDFGMLTVLAQDDVGGLEIQRLDRRVGRGASPGRHARRQRRRSARTVVEPQVPLHRASGNQPERPGTALAGARLRPGFRDPRRPGRILRRRRDARTTRPSSAATTCSGGSGKPSRTAAERGPIAPEKSRSCLPNPPPRKPPPRETASGTARARSAARGGGGAARSTSSSSWCSAADSCGSTVRGADAMGYNWQWYRIPRYFWRVIDGEFIWGPLMTGLAVTIELSIYAMVLTLAIGLVTALLRMSESISGQLLAKVYLEAIRNTPMLVQLLVFYFVIAPVLGIERFWTGVLCLGVFEGAFASEIIRAGINSVPRGQWEASASIGPPAPAYLPFRRTAPGGPPDAAADDRSAHQSHQALGHRERHCGVRADDGRAQHHRRDLHELRGLAHRRGRLPRDHLQPLGSGRIISNAAWRERTDR